MGSVGNGVRSRWTLVAKTLAKHPWLLMSWILLAAPAVAGQKVVPQPWSAGVYPAVLVVALLLFSRVSA
ncbi:hypothetical protein [Streptomyces flaveolus]|uniref:hypothetical protein n=1 Tax=Streptomyces flaveolus TaxID=67297 RepID=UPI003702A392